MSKENHNLDNFYRKIIHIDMDAFFASVEQRDFPKYRNKPLAVGGKGRRGVISAASYEARKYGVKSAMATKVALMKCPHLIIVKSRFEAYKEVSSQIREIFYEYTDVVEPLSLDEAFLDVTENKFNFPSASIIAKKIQYQIKETTGLNASAGVSYNKFLAKIASDYDKPNGFFLIKPEDAKEFVEKLPIRLFFGIGRVTEKKMNKRGIFTGADLKKYTELDLINIFGKQGKYFYKIVRAIDDRPVKAHRLRKSIGTEKTFGEDIFEEQEICSKIEIIAKELYERCNIANTYGKALTLKIKFSDFSQITRSKSISRKFTDYRFILSTALYLFKYADTKNKKIRLIGLSVTKLDNTEFILPYQTKIKF